MTQGRRSRQLIKVLAAAVLTPIILLWGIALLLYLPSVSHYAANEVAAVLREKTPYTLDIKHIDLSFPLKLVIGGYSLSKEGHEIARGERLSLDIGLLPLLKGEIEVNHIILEKTAIDTRDIIPAARISGEIDYLTAVARNIDLASEKADIRMLHIADGNVSVEVTGSTPREEKEQSAASWEITLRKGNIENTAIEVTQHDEELLLSTYLKGFKAKSVRALLQEGAYSTEFLTIEGGTFAYKNKSENILIEEIALRGNCTYTRDGYAAVVETLTLDYDRRISIGVQGKVATDKSGNGSIEALIASAGGSTISCTGTLPLTSDHKGDIAGRVEAHIERNDIKALLPQELRSRIAALPDTAIEARVAVSGTTTNISIDSLRTTIPGVASLRLNGRLHNVGDEKRRNADITFEGVIKNLAPLTGERNGTPAHTPIEFEGKGSVKGERNLASLTLRGNGKAELLATYDTRHGFYDGKADLHSFNVKEIFPTVPIEKATLHAALSGKGFDILDKESYYQFIATVDTLHCEGGTIEGVTLSAFQANGISLASLVADAPDMQLSMITNSRLSKNWISSDTRLDVKNIAPHKLGLCEEPLTAAFSLGLDISTNLKETHNAKIAIEEMEITTAERNLTPAPIYAEAGTSPDALHLEARNGDLLIAAETLCGYKALATQIKEISALWQKKTLESIEEIESTPLPHGRVEFSCGKENLLHDILIAQGINISSAELTFSNDTLQGLNLKGEIGSPSAGGIVLDTLQLRIVQYPDSIAYFAGAKNIVTDKKEKKAPIDITLSGDVREGDKLRAELSLTDTQGRADTHIGTTTQFSSRGIKTHFYPQAMLLGSEIRFNADNYIEIDRFKSVSSNIEVTDGKEGGLRLYTLPDSTIKHDINLEFFNVRLARLCKALPFIPEISGSLHGELRYRDGDTGTMFSGELHADSLIYENTLLGNESIEAIYLPKGNDTHYLSLELLHNDNDIVSIEGDYDKGGIDGSATLTQLPLNLINAFTKESGLDISGHIDGSFSLRGDITAPRSDGYIRFDSVSIDAPLLGSRLRLSDESVGIKESKIIFDNLNIYAKGETPFNINGNIDISRIENPQFNIRMQARNYELVNAPRRKNSIVYGKLFIDLNSIITGHLSSLNIRGTSTILGNSNLTYVVSGSTLAAANELDGLVEFVNFSDSTATAAADTPTQLGNITLSLRLAIEENARLNADFDANRTNYISLQGGGSLNMNYTSEQGVSLTGRYTLSNGEMKYTLPVIPLKTFSISEGSYINWTGDIANPTLDITALERVICPVTTDDGNTQAVAFDVGLVLCNSLDNIGLTFTMRAPENAAVQEELNSFDAETLNKYAVTMLITGAYVGNKGGFTVSNALTSFLDSKINNLASDAMKSVSINVGITDVENHETGDSYTNYNFSFAKRFWNDRLTIVIGGEVNSGASPEQEQSFINNVSLEWRISEKDNRFLRIFYDKNYESILEGEITEAGVGYIYKRKMESLDELLFFKKKEKKEEKK